METVKAVVHYKPESRRSAKNLLLSIAHELTLHPERWTQGWSARDSQDRKVSSLHPSAIRWCLYGHVSKRMGGLFLEYEVHTALALQLGMDSNSFVVGSWNDTKGRTVQEVIDLCLGAAEKIDEVMPL